MKKNRTTHSIDWREWSKEAFAEARMQRRLVLLDLSASWCHWCHVMDETTYSDPAVAGMVNRSFIPVRVDIDQRPDISDRYNRGGFPTTAFLSDMGESVWGATYVPPADMMRIIGSILKAKVSGEIDEALERSRMQYLDLSKTLDRQTKVDSEKIDSVFEDIFSAYDVEFGGFGIQPKFPHPEVIEVLLHRHSKTGNVELADAVTNTLDHMAEGLYDREEGGVFRYSVTRDWRTPHFEKLLETNVCFLRDLVISHKMLGDERYAELARGVVRFLLGILMDGRSGGFYGSQDADEEYYKLTLRERRRRKAPSVDKTIYAGWNAEAAQALIMGGVLMDEASWVTAGKRAFDHVASTLWNEKKGLVMHSKGQELYMLDDQVAFLDSILAVLEIGFDERLLGVADSLIKGVGDAFEDMDGAVSDAARQPDAIGELGTPRKDLVANAKWARGLALLGALAHRPELLDKAWNVLRGFTPKEVEAHGVFASGCVITWHVLEEGPRAVEVYSKGDDKAARQMWRAAKERSGPGTVVVIREDVAEGPGKSSAHAIVCTPKGCSRRLTSTDDLVATLAGTAADS